jgi:hypothetical protein
MTTRRNEEMRKLRRTLMTLVTATAAALAVAGSASGAPPLEGTHTATITSDVIVSARVADGNVFTEEVVTATFVGDVTGMSTWTMHGVIHADGSAEYVGTGTSTVTLAGCGAVTFDFQTQFRASASGVVTGTTRSIGVSLVTYHDSYEGSVLSPIYTDVKTQYRC